MTYYKTYLNEYVFWHTNLRKPTMGKYVPHINTYSFMLAIYVIFQWKDLGF
jgi:hypothetical protein